MERTQAFRVAGTEAMIKAIKVEQVSEKNVIFWDDIEKEFPGVHFVKDDGIMVRFLKDSNGKR